MRSQRLKTKANVTVQNYERGSHGSRNSECQNLSVGFEQVNCKTNKNMHNIKRHGRLHDGDSMNSDPKVFFRALSSAMRYNDA